ncbi:MAG TPA: 2,3-bisphosphoglycerate-independent phosphoglycerate mutase, partial [Pirellulaceae bacterium]|nr:2,3-bisphosphoglycerate-independent phosphoglycerate mutase [Pirellulaceae bacterium]
QDWAIRCNLVTIEDQLMRDFTAGHISTGEARELLASAQNHLSEIGVDAAERLEFVAGVSYRNLLIFRGREGEPAPFSRDTRSTPPHDLTDGSVNQDFPRGPGSLLLADIMSHSVEWFADHPVNRARRQRGQLPATNVWLWGLGQTPQLPLFASRHGVRGAMITAVDLLRGLARLIGWDCIEVPGATGYIDTDYQGKGAAAAEALDQYDLVCVHVEAPDEASHQGNVQEKIAALEQIDAHVVAPLLTKLRSYADWRMLVTPDHPTPLRTKTHSHGDVPFAIGGSGVESDEASEYHELAASNSAWSVPQGWELMTQFINRT